jgi:hypothetical protein
MVLTEPITILRKKKATVGTAVITANKLTSVPLTDGGFGYTSTSAITIAAPAAVTFNGATGVDDTTEEITLTGHPFATGDKVTYSDGGGTEIGGLNDGDDYYVIKVDANTIQLAASLADAIAGTEIDLTDGVGAAHTLTGETATVAVTFGALGSIATITITNPGSGYASAPSVTVADPPTGAGATSLVQSGSAPVSVGSSGTFSATFKIEGSIDGVTWYDLDTSINSATFKQYANPLPYIRANMTAYTSGDLVVKAIF